VIKTRSNKETVLEIKQGNKTTSNLKQQHDPDTSEMWYDYFYGLQFIEGEDAYLKHTSKV
jgi:hypothetical protein